MIFMFFALSNMIMGLQYRIHTILYNIFSASLVPPMCFTFDMYVIIYYTVY